LFTSFESNQRASAQYAEKTALEDERELDVLYMNFGNYRTILGRSTFVYFDRDAINLEIDILSKIADLEKDPREKKNIEEIVKSYHDNQKKLEEELELETLDYKLKYLKNKDLLLSIFPASNVEYTKTEIIKLLSLKLNLDNSESEKFFQDLTEGKTKIIFKHERKAKYFPKDIEYLSEVNKEKIRSLVEEYATLMEVNNNKFPTFEAFIKSYIRTAGKPAAASNYILLSKGWELNNFEKTNFDEIFRETFKDGIETFWYSEWHIKRLAKIN
jgi:hypothetical protein